MKQELTDEQIMATIPDKLARKRNGMDSVIKRIASKIKRDEKDQKES